MFLLYILVVLYCYIMYVFFNFVVYDYVMIHGFLLDLVACYFFDKKIIKEYNIYDFIYR